MKIISIDAETDGLLIQPFRGGGGLRFADECQTHNPFDDAEIAARVYIHLNEKP